MLFILGGMPVHHRESRFPWQFTGTVGLISSYPRTPYSKNEPNTLAYKFQPVSLQPRVLSIQSSHSHSFFQNHNIVYNYKQA